MRTVLLITLMTMFFWSCTKDNKEGNSQDPAMEKNRSGDIVGNGGDNIVLEIRKLAKEAVEIASANHEDWPELSIEKLRGKAKRCKIIPTHRRLLAGGKVKDAVNLPLKEEIYVNRRRWQAIKDSNVKRALVFHELLGLMQVDDNNYRVSSQLLNFDPITFAPKKLRVDILFVVDDSGSMNSHQKSLSDQIDTVLTKISQRNIHYHIGVTSTSSEDGGKLLGKVRYVTSGTKDGLSIIKQSVLLGVEGNYHEKAFQSILDAIDSKNTCVNCANRGFFRRTANLEIVVVSDAEDGSEFSPREVATTLLKFKSSKSSRVGITNVMPITPDCKTDGAKLDKIIELNSLLNGDIRNLCASNIQASYNDLAESLIKRVTNSLKK